MLTGSDEKLESRPAVRVRPGGIAGANESSMSPQLGCCAPKGWSPSAGRAAWPTRLASYTVEPLQNQSLTSS